MRDDDAAWLLLALAMLAGGKGTHMAATITDPDEWCWPMPRLADGRAPDVSSGHRTVNPSRPTHDGVDVMYPRLAIVSKRAAAADHGTTRWEVPAGTPVLAAHAARVWSVRMTDVGGIVVLDHGPLVWATRYLHLETLEVKRGDVVRAGDVLGLCGWSPRDGAKVRHLHFELLQGRADVNPRPMMRQWRILGP